MSSTPSSSSPARRSSSSSWKRSSARRMQLALKHSFSKSALEFETADDGLDQISTGNIDQALCSLYDDPLWRQNDIISSSFVATLPQADFVLDFQLEDSVDMLREFQQSSDLELLLEKVLQRQQEEDVVVEEAQQEEDFADFAGHFEEEGDEFGDFQSATNSDDDACMTPNGSIDDDGDDDATTNTLALVERADELLENQELSTTLSSSDSFDTPNLLRVSERVLDSMQENHQNGGSPPCRGEDEESSMATPVTANKRRVATTDDYNGEEKKQDSNALENRDIMLSKLQLPVDLGGEEEGGACDLSSREQSPMESGDGKKAAADDEDVSTTDASESEFATPVKSPRPFHQRHPSAGRANLFLEEESPISLTLPVEDLTTAEARFTRRRQQRHLGNNKDSDSPHRSRDVVVSPLQKEVAESAFDLDSLPSHYFSRTVDDTARLLSSLPWQYLRDYQPSTHSDSFESNEWILWDETMVSKLCELDSALEAVNEGLLRQIQPHVQNLESANERLHEWDRNLRLAFMYWDRTKGALDEAVGVDDKDGLVGPCTLLDAWRSRDDYRGFDDILKALQLVFEKEKDLIERIDSFDTRKNDGLQEYFAVSKLAEELNELVCDGRLSSLECLDELRTRLSSTNLRFWRRLLVLSEAVVARSCRNLGFDLVEYERLVKAVLDLHTNAFQQVSGMDLAVDWSQSIMSALYREADRALAVGLLNPSGADVSEYDQELFQLSHELDTDWGDFAKLRTITHNLVIIRFDLEGEKCNLPRVLHRLLAGLADVLHTHFWFTRWHGNPFGSHTTGAVQSLGKLDEKELALIRLKLEESREDLWGYCEAVLAKCLDEYLNFSKRRSLFRKDGQDLDDSAWKSDLISLQQAYLLVRRFLALRDHFAPCSSREGSSTVVEKLCNVLRRHLRAVHVEAMNVLGKTLANETWSLANLDLHGEVALAGDSVDVVCRLTNVFSHSEDAAEDLRLREDLQASSDLFEEYQREGNPFGDELTSNIESFSHSYSLTVDCEATGGARVAEVRSTVYNGLKDLVCDLGQDQPLLLTPSSVTKVLIGWFSRLLEIMKRLPMVVEDVSAVCANLCDLYMTTVFRICAGSTKNENILLGIDTPSPFLLVSNDLVTPKQTGTPLFGSFRKSARSNVQPKLGTILPTHLEAEICAPLFCQRSLVSRIRKFVERAHSSLKDVVKLDKVDSWVPDAVFDDSLTVEEHICNVARVLEKREVAALSCFVLAALLDAAVLHAEATLASGKEGDSVRRLEPLRCYARKVLELTSPMVDIARQFSCVRAIHGFELVRRVAKVGIDWEGRKLHEHPNEYVNALIERCSLLWGFLCLSALPDSARSKTWERIVGGSYLALLEGFARVPVCSTEGRALMTLDLASLSAGVEPSSIIERLEARSLIAPHPPVVNPERSFRYVDMYIKVFYYPKDDAMGWIRDNFKRYQMNHILSLVKAIVTDDSPDSYASLVEEVKSLYQMDSVSNS